MNFFQCIQQRNQGCYTEDLKIGDYQTKFECPLLKKKRHLQHYFFIPTVKDWFFSHTNQFSSKYDICINWKKVKNDVGYPKVQCTCDRV